MDVTGASAWPSRLDIENLHRRATQDDTEGISISLRSTPSVVVFVLAFETVGLWMQALRCPGSLGLRPRVFAPPWALGLPPPSDGAPHSAEERGSRA
jgi:hypothetical protein